MSPVVFKLNSKTAVFEEDSIASRALEPREWGIDKDGFKLFLGRWQPNGFLLRQLVPANGVKPNGEINGFFSCGHYESNYWVLQGRTLQTAVWPEASWA
jgi:hypothetical protein